ncbi:hypothetical protein CK203_070883 [Vitis vinifera]|uniref:Lipoyl-binding domain-containing protein n=1 Tax=Vitis vinifera TaxID=29760 RepID=A0A438E3N8_VITVI|nr:hypothetical protein CK203_070883 [Vitis vinifera]
MESVAVLRSVHSEKMRKPGGGEFMNLVLFAEEERFVLRLVEHPNGVVMLFVFSLKLDVEREIRLEVVGSIVLLGYSVGAISNVRSFIERPTMVPMYNATWPTSNTLHVQGLTVGGKLISSPIKQKGTLISCVKTPETAGTAKCDDGNPQGLLQKDTLPSATFPNGFEALILEVCDETDVAELKLKVNSYILLNIPIILGTLVLWLNGLKMPWIMENEFESAPAAPPSLPPKPSQEKISPFTKSLLEKPSKLRALEASGANAYVLVSSPTVGSFRTGRTLKGKRQPPVCKEGDVIKEGQVIGYLDQFGSELPVKSDTAGEVLKVIFNDGEAVGYGDPLVAVLPSFHGIE